MSRIGKMAIPVPKGVEVSIGGGKIAVKGPKGRLETMLNQHVTAEQKDGTLTFKRKDDTRPAKSAHGLMRATVANMITGVTNGFERQLEINGVGYRAELKGKSVNFLLGFSHPIDFKLPDGVTAKLDKNLVILSGIDKVLLGQVAANMRALRPPEPYKGKGVKYLEERIQRKAGKAASK